MLSEKELGERVESWVFGDPGRILQAIERDGRDRAVLALGAVFAAQDAREYARVCEAKVVQAREVVDRLSPQLVPLRAEAEKLHRRLEEVRIKASKWDYHDRREEELEHELEEALREADRADVALRIMQNEVDKARKRADRFAALSRALRAVPSPADVPELAALKRALLNGSSGA